MTMTRRGFALTSLAALGTLGTLGALSAPAYLRTSATYFQGNGSARNVILMISDGAGFHTWTAASYYRHGRLGRQVYDSWPVRTLMTTYPLNISHQPTGNTMAGRIRNRMRQISYDAAAAWNPTRMGGEFEGWTGTLYGNNFAGYDYVRQNFTDSAAAGTALSAGIKTYNHAINWTNGDQPARMMGDRAKSTGRALGVVSSVQVSHATPAAFLCHNRSRDNYAEMGREILETGLADLVMGAGHPMFDRDGREVTPSDDNAFRFVGGADAYARLVSGQTGYHLLDTRADFEALAAGTLALQRDKIFGLTPVERTLQYDRAGVDSMGGMLQTVPSLETMTRGALNFLAQKENGFFLMVEGGAVDWACHRNNLPRMIEEQIDFDRSVEAVAAWVEANSSWDETLVIVTTDHGNGILYGPESDHFAFQPVINRGAGNLPEVRWHFDQHTNELVPVWARGPGADLLNEFSAGVDENTALVGWGEQTRYHDNTDLAKAMEIVMSGTS
jgi:alkaline phosphatase